MGYPRDPQFDHLPDHLGPKGEYLYAFALCDGTVKVGRTWNPRARMLQHAGSLRRAGAKRIVGSYAQIGIGNICTAERDLLARLHRIASPLPDGRREYFHGVSLGAAGTLIAQVARREHVDHIPSRED